MSGSATITPLATFRNDSPYPFCPGCGHGVILNRLNEALVQLDLDPHEVVLVSDIGCSGLSDQYFATNAFHGLHGRSVTYACGIKLARPELTVVVIMGDGGTGIGGTHLLNAARRNIGVTVLVFNNFNFGMTGGQHSTTTPLAAVTSTTLAGNLERPLDICGTLAVNGAGFAYRGTSFDKHLSERIAEGIRSPGFAILDIWELCTAYYAPSNQLTGKALFGMLEELGLPVGVVGRNDVEDYGDAFRRAHPVVGKRAVPGLEPLEPGFEASLDKRFELAVAGSAGEKVRSAVRLAARAGILSGLRATQRDDYPITVQSGHSLSELILSPVPFAYSGMRKPDALLVLSEDGLKKAQGYLDAMGAEDRVFAIPGLRPQTRASLTIVDPRQAAVRVTRHNRSLVALAAMLSELDLFQFAALEAAAGLLAPAYRAACLEAILAGRALGAIDQ
ncbi:MAG: 2-oxoglutarate synthase [bacterium]|nr:2-oxoglutarate synthase [bacterium]